MQEPEKISYFFANHASGRFTASYTPVMKNSHNTAPMIATPQANNALPLPGAADHNPPMADETVGSLASLNHRKQFDRNGLGMESDKLCGCLIISQHNERTRNKKNTS